MTALRWCVPCAVVAIIACDNLPPLPRTLGAATADATLHLTLVGVDPGARRLTVSARQFDRVETRTPSPARAQSGRLDVYLYDVQAGQVDLTVDEEQADSPVLRCEEHGVDSGRGARHTLSLQSSVCRRVSAEADAGVADGGGTPPDGGSAAADAGSDDAATGVDGGGDAGEALILVDETREPRGRGGPVQRTQVRAGAITLDSDGGQQQLALDAADFDALAAIALDADLLAFLAASPDPCQPSAAAETLQVQTTRRDLQRNTAGCQVTTVDHLVAKLAELRTRYFHTP